MSSISESGPKARGMLRTIPWITLLGILCLTYLTWDHERFIARRALHSQFNFALRETVSRIDQRIQGYEQMLRGVQSVYATTHWRNRAAFHDYVESLQLDANFSGAQAIGVVEWVPAKNRAAHTSAMRAAGFKDYAIDPQGEREAYGPVVQREPYQGRNRTALGNDAWNDPDRRAAMTQSRDTGMAVITGKVSLRVDVNTPPQPSFIMYLPIYDSPQHNNAMQRRQHVVGWVYAAFHMQDFLASLYGSNTPGLSLAIFDGTGVNAESWMYGAQPENLKATLNTDNNGISAIEYMVVAGHNWTLSLSTEDEFLQLYGRNMANEMAATGIILSVAMALLAWLMINGRQAAMNYADSMTEELRHMAQHDSLTGLPNRALFSDRLNRELERAKRDKECFAMLFIDLDNFKPINDVHGHDVGDKVLQQVGRNLQDCLRSADTVGRIGGDEFVVLLTRLSDHDHLRALAEKIRQSVCQPMVIDNCTLSVSCSAGVAVYPKDGVDEFSLTKSADKAMYQAKDQGRNCIRFS